MSLRSMVAAAVCSAILLTGCGGSPPEPPAPAPAATSEPTKEPKTIPDVAGKKFSEARDLLAASGIVYEAVGSDGAKFTDKPPATAVVEGTDPAAGDKAREDGSVILRIKGTQGELRAQAAAAAEAAARATRYEFRCSPTGNAITAKDNQVFHSVKDIWTTPSFAQFKSCDLDVDGTWFHDKFTLEADETAVVKQIGADGGDISLPSSAYAGVLLLCAIPPQDGWDRKYGENPAGPKIRSQAKAAVNMCPDAPFAAELKRVADGVPPAPKTTIVAGTFIVGKDIAEGTYQVTIPAGANGVHDCYWERTSAQGATIANDFITFAPQGPVVTVYAGEGFVSKSCGTWTKVG